MARGFVTENGEIWWALGRGRLRLPPAVRVLCEITVPELRRLSRCREIQEKIRHGILPASLDRDTLARLARKAA